MKGLHATGTGLLLLALAGGCAPSPGALPALLRTLSGPPETGSVGTASPRTHETSVVVSGTPTAVYALVARGMLGCWFGANGALKGSHLFRAQAEPPAQGGDASIVIYERDTGTADQRGTRSYRVGFVSAGAMVRVDVTALKFEQARAEVMATDVAAWAKGSAGCRLRGRPPQQAPSVSKTGKRRTATKAR